MLQHLGLDLAVFNHWGQECHGGLYRTAPICQYNIATETGFHHKPFYKNIPTWD